MNRFLPVAAVLVLVRAACGCGDDDATPAAPPRTGPEVTTTQPPSLDGAQPASWEQVAAPPDCACSDGSPYPHWVRRADPERVLFFLEGGGACFSAETCGPASPTFTRHLACGAAGAHADGGIFDLDDPRNPFDQWSIER